MKRDALTDGLRALELPLPATDAAIERLILLSDLLEHKAIPRGFLSEGESTRIVSRHVLESAALMRWVDPAGSLIDVGSGAGLPGLVLACLGRLDVTLLDAQARRAMFLREAVRALEIDAKVVHGRAEDVARGALRESFACATARALASAGVALELLLPLVAPGGKALLVGGPLDDFKERGPCDSGGHGALKSRSSSSEDRARRLDSLARASEELGAAAPIVAQFAVPGVEESRWVTIVRKLRSTPDGYPRSPAAMRRRPLGGDVT